MTKVYLVRHGEAAAGWGQDIDPPLSEKGKSQANKASQILGEKIENIRGLACISSPIKRAHETAQTFAEQYNKNIILEPRVAEIPSPGLDLEKRMPWLMSVMGDKWSNLDNELKSWRQSCIDFILSLEQDTVIFSHYIAINVLIGHCQNDDRVICFRPDNCSIHEFEIESRDSQESIKIIKLGKEAETKIN
jgi:broad specificity phosphatase PhoE